MATRPRRTSRPVPETPTLLLPPPEPAALANLQAEQAVLAGVLMQPAALDTVRPLLPDASMFFFDEGRQVYAAMLSLHDQGVAIDHITLPEEVFTMTTREPDEVRGYLGNLLDAVPDGANAPFHAAIVRELADRRESYSLLRRMLNDVAHRGTEFRQAVGTGIAKLGARVAAAPAASPPLRGSLLAAIDDIDATWKAGSNVTGLPTGIPPLDALTHGLQPGTLVIIAGRPSMGKTALLLHLARQAGGYQRDRGDAEPDWAPWPTLIDSLEMSARGLCKRLLKAESGVDWWDPRTEHTAPRAYMDAAAYIASWPLEVEQACRTITELQIRCDVFRRRYPDEPMLLGIDYLSHLRLDYSTGEGRRDVLIGEQVTRPLTRIARDQNAVVVLLSQIGRGGVRHASTKRDGGPPPALARPMLSDIKDSGDIEQDADLVLFVHPLGPNGEHREDGHTELGLAKHRDGPTGWVDTYFDRALGRYRPWSRN